MATANLISRIPSSSNSDSSHLSSGDLSGGRRAAVIIGTVLAVGLVCLLLFCPRLLFAQLKKSRSRDGVPRSTREVPLTGSPPLHPGRASGNDRSTKGADRAGSTRRRSEAVREGSTQQHGNGIRVGTPSRSPVVINNNIYIDSSDYLQPLPSLNSAHNRDPAAPGGRIPRDARGASGNRDLSFGLPPDGIIPPQRGGNDEAPASTIMATTSEQNPASNFWDVTSWARCATAGQAPRSRIRQSIGSPVREAGGSPVLVRRQDGSFTRVRRFDVPRAFPENKNAMERFQLVTAPARAHAPRAPSHGDNGFWLREARGNRWKRQEREDRRDEQEREDRRERQEREERGECDRLEREERRERDRIEREERRARQGKEEKRERQEREGRRDRQDELRWWRDV